MGTSRIARYPYDVNAMVQRAAAIFPAREGGSWFSKAGSGRVRVASSGHTLGRADVLSSDSLAV